MSFPFPLWRTEKITRRFKDNFAQILQVVEDLKAIGAKHGVSAGQVTLAWVLAQGDDFIPIPGTKNIKASFTNTKGDE